MIKVNLVRDTGDDGHRVSWWSELDYFIWIEKTL